MTFDLVIPTYNRAALLANTLESVLRARRPAGMEVRVYVVDNNSTAETRQTVERFTQRASWMTYLRETKQGLSHARNAGIAAGSGEYVGMIDDDEELAEDWFEVAHRALTPGDLDFIGGPYKGLWVSEAPDWLPPDYPAVIGVIDAGPVPHDFGPDFNAMLMGGNAIVRRALLDRVGPFNTALGRTPRRLSAGEDEEMYLRLLAAGGRGRYLPDLVIYHHIPPARLTKRYHRRWCFWQSVSMGFVDFAQRRSAEPSLYTETAYLLGVPRWRIREVAGALGRLALGLVRRRPPVAQFSDELSCWSLAGLVYGKAKTAIAARRGERRGGRAPA